MLPPWYEAGHTLPVCHAAQVFASSTSLPDFSCSNQWSISINMQLPAVAIAGPFDASGTRLVQLLEVLSGGDGTGKQGGPWPRVSLKCSLAGTSLLVQWGDNAASPGDSSSREQPITIRPNKDGWASVNVAVVRDGTRLGVWLDSNGSWVMENVWCIPAQPEVHYCTQPVPSTADMTFRQLKLGDAGAAAAGITATTAKVYNYALPKASLAAESGCADDGSCGRFLVAGWSPPDASSIPAGSITGSSIQPVSSTPIRLKASSYYLLVSWAAALQHQLVGMHVVMHTVLNACVCVCREHCQLLLGQIPKL